MPNPVIHLITGAPGAGKSATLAAFLQLNSPYIAFDIDWLAETASVLAGSDIRFTQPLWKPYNALWFAILQSIRENHKVPVLFAPLDPNDIAALGQLVESAEVQWLLLDCDDKVRRERLAQRSGWTNGMIEEAVADAQFLRKTVPDRIDTGKLQPPEVATEILKWLQKTDE